MNRKNKIIANIIYILMVIFLIVVVESSMSGYKVIPIVFGFMAISVRSKIGIYLALIYYMITCSRYYVADIAFVMRYGYAIILIAVMGSYINKLLNKLNKDDKNNRFIKDEKTLKIFSWTRPYDFVIWMMIIILSQSISSTPLDNRVGVFIDEELETIGDVLEESDRIMEVMYKDKDYKLIVINIEVVDKGYGEFQEHVNIIYDLNNSVYGSNQLTMSFNLRENVLEERYLKKNKNVWKELNYTKELNDIDVKTLCEDIVKKYGVDELKKLSEELAPYITFNIHEENIYGGIGYFTDIHQEYQVPINPVISDEFNFKIEEIIK